jgi:glycosyltransferase involved in cell wall biosynthesis
VLKILVVIENELLNGGGFQQALSTILLLNKYNKDKYHFEFITTNKNNITILERHGIKVDFIRKTMFYEIFYFCWAAYWPMHFLKKFKLINKSFFETECIRRKADLVYFLTPSANAMFLDETNFIITIWDLCHRDYPEFPEIRRKNAFEQREILYNRVLKKAVAVIVDSSLGRINTVNRYGVNYDRAIPISFFPNVSTIITEKEYNDNYIDIKLKYSIQGEYIFYPAQFWAHKNHRYIIDAIDILENQYNKNCNVLFCGSDKGNLSYVLDLIFKKQFKSKFCNLGFVEGSEMPYLYKQALALVMPTYFGPTNMPPLEAFILGCPVIYSDLPEFRRQVEDAGLLVDLNNPESLASVINDLLTDNQLRISMAEKGRNKIQALDPEYVWKQHEIIFSQFDKIKKCWKS